MLNSEMRRLARQGTISVEIEGNTTSFEQQIHTLDEIGSLQWERQGAEFRITFLGTEPLPIYIERVLQLIDRTGADEIEEAFLTRLEEDRTRGFLRAAAWAATQDVAGTRSGPNGNGKNIVSQEPEVIDAGVPGDLTL